jgi:hypothetical protein
MKILDNVNRRKIRAYSALELTRGLPLWNYPKTVALYFASREGILNRATKQRNFWDRVSVKCK